MKELTKFAKFLKLISALTWISLGISIGKEMMFVMDEKSFSLNILFMIAFFIPILYLYTYFQIYGIKKNRINFAWLILGTSFLAFLMNLIYNNYVEHNANNWFYFFIGFILVVGAITIIVDGNSTQRYDKLEKEAKEKAKKEADELAWNKAKPLMVKAMNLLGKILRFTDPRFVDGAFIDKHAKQLTLLRSKNYIEVVELIKNKWLIYISLKNRECIDKKFGFNSSQLEKENLSEAEKNKFSEFLFKEE